MPIKKGDTVRAHYTGTLDDGTVFDSSRERDPLEFVLGKGMLIPGFEAAVEGREVGETVTVTIAPEDAYGLRVEEAVQTVPREAFAQIPDLAVGMQLHGESPQGPMSVVVKEVNDDSVVVDANHPLAGETLHFAVKIDSVREATESELAHGHAHGGDGHHH